MPVHSSGVSIINFLSDGLVLDYDAQGNLVGIDIDNASRKIDLREVVLSKIPAEVETLTA
jgi:uncharacterized protein YuzE